MKRFEHHPITRDGMVDGAKRLKFPRLKSESRIKNILRALFLAIGFKIRELPQMCVHNSKRTLLNEKFSIALNDEGNKMSRGRRFALAKIRQFFCEALLQRDAEFFHRTNQTLRIARRANERAEFHQRLVEKGTGIIFT